MSPFPRRASVVHRRRVRDRCLCGGVPRLYRGAACTRAQSLVFGALVRADGATTGAAPRTACSCRPGFMVCMAAIVVFRDEHSLLGALIVCSLALPARRQLPQGVVGLAAVQRRAVGAVVPRGGARLRPPAARPPRCRRCYSVVVVMPAALAYLAVAWLVARLSYVVEGASVVASRCSPSSSRPARRCCRSRCSAFCSAGCTCRSVRP